MTKHCKVCGGILFFKSIEDGIEGEYCPHCERETKRKVGDPITAMLSIFDAREINPTETGEYLVWTEPLGYPKVAFFNPKFQMWVPMQLRVVYWAVMPTIIQIEETKHASNKQTA